MKIVCLAWGSLIWKPEAVPVGEWRPGGPSLPIEFARVGESGELATVVTPGAPTCAVHWARLREPDLSVATTLLRQREGIRDDHYVGMHVAGVAAGPWLGAVEIDRWARAQGEVEAVIWTALPPRFDETVSRVPSPDEAARYLASLVGERRRHAEDYVRRVPEEIAATPNRRALEALIAATSPPAGPPAEGSDAA